MREPVRGGSPARSFFGMSGLDQARALLRNEAPRPPISHLTGLRITQVGSGSATVTVPASVWLRVPDGSIDVPIALEAALSAAATTGAPAGSIVRTASLTVNHFRPAQLGEIEKLIVRARVVNSGRTFTFAAATVEDDLGRPIAHGTAALVAHAIEPPPPDGSTYQAAEPARFSTPDPWERPPPAGEAQYEAWATETGISVVRKMADGTFGEIPIYLLTGMRMTEADAGFCASELIPSEWIADSAGAVSSGVIACMMSVEHCPRARRRFRPAVHRSRHAQPEGRRRRLAAVLSRRLSRA